MHRVYREAYDPFRHLLQYRRGNFIATRKYGRAFEAADRNNSIEQLDALAADQSFLLAFRTFFSVPKECTAHRLDWNYPNKRKGQS